MPRRAFTPHQGLQLEGQLPSLIIESSRLQESKELYVEKLEKPKNLKRKFGPRIQRLGYRVVEITPSLDGPPFV